MLVLVYLTVTLSVVKCNFTTFSNDLLLKTDVVGVESFTEETVNTEKFISDEGIANFTLIKTPTLVTSILSPTNSKKHKEKVNLNSVHVTTISSPTSSASVTINGSHIEENINSESFFIASTLAPVNPTTKSTTTTTKTSSIKENVTLENVQVPNTLAPTVTTTVNNTATTETQTNDNTKGPTIASFFRTLQWYYWLLLLLIIPIVGSIVGAYYYFKKRKKSEGYNVAIKDSRTRRNSTPSWVFSEPDFIDEEVFTLEQEKK